LAQYSIDYELEKEDGYDKIIFTMESISTLFEQEALAAKLKEEIVKLADKYGGRVIVLDQQNKIVSEGMSSTGLGSLIALNNKIKEKFNQEWLEIQQLIISRGESFFMEGDYGLIVFWMPICITGKTLGGLIGYGGFFDDACREEEKREKQENLYYLLGLNQMKISWDEYMKAVEGIKFIKPDDLEQSVKRLAALLGALATGGR